MNSRSDSISSNETWNSSDGSSREVSRERPVYWKQLKEVTKGVNVDTRGNLRVQVEDSARKDRGNVYYWGRKNYVPRNKLAEYTNKAKELYALDVKEEVNAKERSTSASKNDKCRSKSRSSSRKRNAESNVVYKAKTDRRDSQPESKSKEKLYFQQESPEEIIYTERNRYAGGQIYSIYHSSCSDLDRLRDSGNGENFERDKKVDLGFISDGTKW